MLPDHLRILLKSVSRSFYLSVRVLPSPVRTQVAVGYLLARAADTLADTTHLPLTAAARLELLATLRAATAGQAAEQKALLLRLHALIAEAPPPPPEAKAELLLLAKMAECLNCLFELSAADRVLVERVLDRLLAGMEQDMRRFPVLDNDGGGAAIPPSQVVALKTDAELDTYTYYAAGCVGEFWTDLMAAHIPALRALAQGELRERGVALGKALQMVNVVRDVVADLRAGRCYWPAELLATHGLSPARFAALLTATDSSRPDPTAQEAAGLRAASMTLIAWGHKLCAQARPYVNAIPATEVRLRLACTWPLLLAIETLRALADAQTPLAGRVKVPRRRVYDLLLRSSAATLADLPAGSRHIDRLLSPS